MTARRFLMLQVLLVWQGGFVFYAAFVVPVGTQLWGAAAQGAVTARVTDALNGVGLIGVGLLALEVAYSRDPHPRRTVCRWSAWSIVMVCQFVLLYLHQLLEAFMDDDRRVVIVQPPFYPVHRVYLWVSTILWLACCLWLWWTLRAWTAEDRAADHKAASTQPF
ncbi:MAG: hypothetical protein RMJ56_12270 [Gemmataceae bacterium]|nr:hypothetical protein [Gemmata sp.]MDW8198368.1 hypothetical protein [Gemmataceae bacterium]